MKQAPGHIPDILQEYSTTSENTLSPEETLRLLRESGLTAMIDAESGLWINEMCMGRFDSIYAQRRAQEFSSSGKSAASPEEKDVGS